MMKKEKLEWNGEIVTFEKDEDGHYYFNGLKLRYDYDKGKFIGLSLVGFDESKYNDTKCIILPNWVTMIQSKSIPKRLKESLEYVYGPGVKAIGYGAFEDCKALKICATSEPLMTKVTSFLLHSLLLACGLIG